MTTTLESLPKPAWYPFDEEHEKKRKAIELEERQAKIKQESDTLLIKKMESLVDLLEASHPNTEKGIKGFGDEESSNYVPVLDDTDKKRVIKRIFSLIDKY